MLLQLATHARLTTPVLAVIGCLVAVRPAWSETLTSSPQSSARTSHSVSAASSRATPASPDAACAAPRTGYATRAAAAAAMAPKGDKASLAEFADTPIRDLRTGAESTLGALWADSPVVLLFLRRLGCQMCRLSAKELSAIVPEIEAAGGRAVAFTFEKLNEGSDADGSFEKGRYWPAALYNIDRGVYDRLFGAKTSIFDSGYGLLDSRAHAVIKRANEAGVKGNLVDGFKSGLQLGGQFVVAKGGEVKLDHRQDWYGDDASGKLESERERECGGVPTSRGHLDVAGGASRARAAALTRRPRPARRSRRASGGAQGSVRADLLSLSRHRPEGRPGQTWRPAAGGSHNASGRPRRAPVTEAGPRLSGSLRAARCGPRRPAVAQAVAVTRLCWPAPRATPGPAAG